MTTNFEKDHNIAITALGLKGQAQFDFLIDYFNSLRFEGYQKAKREIINRIKEAYKNCSVLGVLSEGELLKEIKSSLKEDCANKEKSK